MIDLDTLRWPPSDVRGKLAIIPEAREAVPFFLEHVSGRRGVIQAGGNVGVYPIALAEHFEEVVTFEPERANYACLIENLADLPMRDSKRIIPICAALDEVSDKPLRLNVTEPDNCGAHQFMPPIGDGPTTLTARIDDLSRRTPIDMIWLDVEGAELPALKGALATIERHAPAIILEEKNHGKLFGYSDADLHQFLGCLGYAERARYANDRLYLRG